MTQFRFSGAFGTLGGASGELEPWHPSLPTQIFSANGFGILTNGWNLNRRFVDLTDTSGDDEDALGPLQMAPPNMEIYPLLSAVGTGKVHGNGLKWRVRFRNSRTGEVSGMSPVPTVALNVGTEAIDGGSEYLGQKAIFSFSQNDDPLYSNSIQGDELQLIRNTSGQEELWYVVDTKTITVTMKFEDNTPDEELVFNELANLLPAPNFGETQMPPVVKSYAHPTGRTWYYGIRRMARYGIPTEVLLSATVGESFFSLPSAAVETDDPIPFHYNRVGQKLRVGTEEVYRITHVGMHENTGAFVYYVYPPAESTGSATWYIEDDRDARAIYMSEPGVPWCIDPLKTIYVGMDMNDEVYHIFSLQGRTFVHTRRRIYAIINDYSEDPSLSATIQAVSEEGTVGFFSGCATPFGWVFLHPTMGVRLFDGSSTMPLPGESSYDDFIAREQIDRIDPSFLADTVLVWDTTSRKVFVSYVPNGNIHHREAMSFSADDRNWRGPHYMNLYSAGSLYETAGDEKPIYGDDFGNLFEFDQQELDMVPYTTGLTLSGSVASVSNAGLTITVTGATFDPNSDAALRGCPIVFTRTKSGTVTQWRARIHSIVSATSLRLESHPVGEQANDSVATIAISGTETWDFAIGAIRWYGETAYIDAGEPIQPKTCKRLRLRWERPSTTGANTFDVAAEPDESGSFGTEDGTSTAKTVDPDGVVYGDVRLGVNGVAHKLRFRGISRDGHPKITAAILDLDVRSGVRRND